MNPKLKELLASRRFWVSIAACVAAGALYAAGVIDADRMAAWVEWAGLAYGGALALEHVARVPGGTK